MKNKDNHEDYEGHEDKTKVKSGKAERCKSVNSVKEGKAQELPGPIPPEACNALNAEAQQ